jgi:hypothetical protein
MSLGADIMGGQLAKGHFVLTRLHARYGKHDMKDDLRFEEAQPVTGGREQWGKNGIEYATQPSTQNFFQARYAIRHWWTGPIKCKDPKRGVWGGPTDGGSQMTIAAGKTAFAPRGKIELASLVNRDLWEIGLKRKVPPPPAPPAPAKPKALGFLSGGLGGFLIVALVLLRRRRSR